MRHTKTVGVILDDEVTGLTLIAEPVGLSVVSHLQQTQLQPQFSKR